jgi:mono/diheme cytochrome c family protein
MKGDRTSMLRLASAYLAALSLAACKGYVAPSIKEPLKLAGGRIIPVAQLESGRDGYMQYCRPCHGERGDGKGPASPGLRPPPRDFTAGLFKFAAVPGGALPHDEDLLRIARNGLHGTAMLAWDVPEPRLQDIVQYLKTFSPRWKEEEPGEAITASPDPWAGKTAEGVTRGRKLYHGMAQCLGCHPAYASRREIDAASRELTGNPTTDFRADLYGALLKESDYGTKLLPPDFTRSELRSIRAGHESEDLYRVIASGVGGTAMPSWKGSLPEEDLWALVHYVSTLIDSKDTPAATQLLERNLADDATWSPPQPEKP